MIKRRQQSLQATLAGATLLRDLPPTVLAELAAAARHRVYRAGEVICHVGDPGDTLHVVEFGRVKVTVYTEAGGEVLLNVLGPGDCFGELALIDGEPRSATVEALELVETVTLHRADFLRMLHSNEAALEPLLATLARTIRRLSDAVADVSFLSLEGRLAKKLLALSEEHGREIDGSIEIQLPISQEELASMVGATRPSVNKVLGQLEDDRIINRRGRRIVVREPSGLRDRIA
jgi:CRP/FNR family transcriptional regulator/CRP/FNR family cyclic AMP-dependent transcriptional regulator